jgi:hypothetical protein
MRSRRGRAARERLAERGVDHVEVVFALLELAVDQQPKSVRNAMLSARSAMALSSGNRPR